MTLPRPGAIYDRANEAQARDAVRRALERSYRRGEDVELAPGQRLILRSPGGRWRLEADDAGLLRLEPLGAAPIAVIAAEALAAGDLCNLFSLGGAAAIRRASAADAGRPANAFVRAACAPGDTAVPGFTGQAIGGLAGLTPGAVCWLDAAPGRSAAAPPTAAGALVQEVGVALSASVMIFAPKTAVQL